MLNGSPKVSPPSLAGIFVRFLRLGLTAFGGPSMVDYIRKMAVKREGWLDEATFQDGVALCQTVPGATAMQTAAYVGFRVRGVPGALAAFTGFGLPAFLLMMALSAIYMRARKAPPIVSVLDGLRAIVVAIVANAAFSFGRAALKGWRHIAIAGVAVLLFGFQISPLLVIAAAGVLGLGFLSASAASSPPRSLGGPGLRDAAPVFYLLGGVAVASFALFLASPSLFQLAALMARIDLLAFGGGFASVPLMHHETVEVRHWLDSQTLLDGIALGQVTPGPIVITATFVGYALRGARGAVVSTIAVFTPSFLLVVGVAPYFDRLRSSPRVARAISGILCSFVGLLLTVAVRFAVAVHWNVPQVLLAAAAMALLLLRLDILWVVLGGVAASILLAAR